ncbi:MAG TPA: hypothetical protein VGV67_09265 [Solirubrobacteraceae bacterium]|nr:hypothetical protein [Solirubrobacteraceae bacterium]
MPKFAGAPDPVRLSDRLLVEWVAQAKPGDPFPEPWCQAHAPLKSMVTQLVELGVIAPPPPDASVAEIARDATAAARVWLEEHPAPPPQPDPPPRGASRGRSYGR